MVILRDLMLKKKVWAVVGANNKPEKFGYKIYKKLKDFGYIVYPVNPTCNIVDGDRCYPDLSSLPELPEVIDMVVAPKRGKAVIEEAAMLGISYIWLQPGTSNRDILELIESKKNIIAVQDCVLVALQ